MPEKALPRSLPRSKSTDGASDFAIRPLTPAEWHAFEDLFGPERGASSGCWCMWTRMPRPQWKAMPREERKAAFRAIVESGPAPGLLAFDGDKAAAWCAIAPRSDTAKYDGAKVSQLPDSLRGEPTPFSITCFYIRAGYRNRGLMGLLAEAAVAHARSRGASSVDVCAIETERKLMWGEGFVGIASVFRKLGFQEIARRTPTRPLMRLSF